MKKRRARSKMKQADSRAATTRTSTYDTATQTGGREQLKRAFKREQEALRAAEARAELQARRGVGNSNEQPAKRMCVRIGHRRPRRCTGAR